MKDIDIAFLPELLNLTLMPKGVEHYYQFCMDVDQSRT
ncbi:Uncharacterized protein XB15_02083 [Leptospira santarosai]|nr:Uncharacterized protein XB15_02083 [Leptospira santarosai]